MFIELHLLQNFAPSCLNRDDTNSPKECTFGGTRRARLSSQCLKRAARTHPVFAETVGGAVGKRTKKVADELADRLVKAGRDEVDARLVAEAALVVAGFDKISAEVKEGHEDELEGASAKTSVLLYVGDAELDAMAATCDQYFDSIRAAINEKSIPKKGAKKRALKVKAPALPKDCKKALENPPDAKVAADVALFGRMVAQNTNLGLDASCQVAHALSTHSVETELDFFTAVDDLSPKEDTGAGMMGIVEFNSACFYRFSLVDFRQLVENLGGDRDLAKGAVLGYLKATVAAIPTGKQNSMAAHNPPEYVRVVVRKDGAPQSLANAFQRPVRPGRDESLMVRSIAALRDYRKDLAGMYGEEEGETEYFASVEKLPGQMTLPEIWKAVEKDLS